MKVKDKYSKYYYNSQIVWEIIDTDEKNRALNLSNDYKKFLNAAKTERTAIKEVIERAEENGFVSIDTVIASGSGIKEGMKLYAINQEKSAILFVIGSGKITEGLNIIGSHVDSPRIDIKQVPLYEEKGIALLKTHYYGKIKKYQWTAIPLALYGTVVLKSGKIINISIGDNEDEPIFYITDLPPHLSKNQDNKVLSEGIEGENLNILIGSFPYEDKDTENKFILNILEILNNKYGIVESDFISAEFEAVPAGKARDVGIDRSMIAGHGHDDRVCAYTSLKAILETENNFRTAVALFVDKEEIGSYGNTGMQSEFFNNTLAELINVESDYYSDLFLRRTLAKSSVLSADVSVAFDPNYPYITEERNTSYLGRGVTLVKYTGVSGKSGVNDANAEYIAKLMKIFDDSNIVWQTGELGKVDQGGGSTISHMLAKFNMSVIDIGVPVLSMHSPIEVVNKADVYMTYKAFKSFFLNYR